MPSTFESTIAFARQKDQQDPLQSFRSRFHFPPHPANGSSGDAAPRDAIYFCGNSLGLQPKDAQAAIQQELDDWKEMAIGGYLHAQNPWLTYHDNFRRPLSKIVGCLEDEVTVMNALTVNLHLLLLSFYHPDTTRYKIIMEAGAFPSDQYALETQARIHGFDPDDVIIEISPRSGEKTIREEDILTAIEQNKDALALVLLGGINYYTGQLFDMQMITAATHQAGAFAGFDLAHAVGNVPLRLHDWEVDFAVWCSYKYLNGGPGAVGGAYLHERYARNKEMVRLGGWWGNDEATRFKMEKGFIPKPNAGGWSLSTAQVFNMVALKASLPLFEEAGMEKIRAKSLELTDYLAYLLQQLSNLSFEIITPMEPQRRGAQLSLYFSVRGKEIHQKMTEAGIIVDYREPGVIRVAPAPLYNSFEDVYRFYLILKQFQ
ncbi:MAG TPA: kynureninase [Puia sp.]|nr:kynureninase [Puia sp.]